MPTIERSYSGEMICWFLLVFLPIVTADPCQNYKLLSEQRRSTLSIPQGTDRLLCDRALVTDWYRFSNGDMPTSCVPTNHCGTNVPIWLNGQLPTASDGIVTRRACYNLGKHDNPAFYGGTTCCHLSQNIQVKNCGTYNVYHLSRTSGCSMSYCAGNRKVCPIGQSSIGTSTCTELYPKMTHFPTLGHPYVDSNNNVKFPCHIPYPKGVPNVSFDVTWTADGQAIIDPGTQTPVVTTLTGDDRNVLLDGRFLQGHLGKTIKCNVTSYHTNTPGLKSDSLSSNGFWAGIRVSKPSITVDEKGKKQEITLESTVPIPCNNPHPSTCSVHVEMMASKDPNDISTSSCYYELKYDNATGTYKATVDITATRDFVKDGNQLHELAFRPIFNFVHPMWNGYQIQPVQIKSVDRGHGRCSTSGDPHVRQIDSNRNIPVYDIGDLVLYKSKTRPFEVDIRTWPCGHFNPCICAAVVREGNDVIQVDMCAKRQNQLAAPEIKVLSHGPLQGTTINRDPTGRKFYVNFPSGARAVIQAYVYRHHRERDGYLTVNLQVPSDDIGSSEGLCGTFDGNNMNDLLGKYGHIYGKYQISSFVHTWLLKPGQSLFDTLPATNPAYNHKNINYCQCDRGHADCTKANARNPSAGICSSHCIPITQSGLRPRDLDYHTEPMRRLGRNSARIVWKRSFPTPSGMTQSMAVSTCTDSIQNASLFSRCGHSVLSSDIIQRYIDACVQDMMFADGDVFNIAHMDAFDSECQDAVLRNISNYSVQPNGDRIPPIDVTSQMCPSQCSRRGTCHQGNCSCQIGYTGGDCSIPIGVAPDVSHFRGDGLCDIRDRPCRKVQVIADNIMDGPGLKCRYQRIEIDNGSFQRFGEYTEIPAKFTSFMEVECELPTSAVIGGDLPMEAFMISVTIDGHLYSTDFPFIVYDGLCHTCDINGTCTLKQNTCLIDGRCRAQGELNGAVGFCDSQNDPYHWTSDPAVSEISHYTSTGTGCQCGYDKSRYDCACCTSGGCQCGGVKPNICTSCEDVQLCINYPNVTVRH